MIRFPEARATILSHVQGLGDEFVAYPDFHGRVVACAFASGLDLPPFDNSQVDGYAVSARDDGSRRIVGESAAGGPPPPPVGSGEAVRIFTGAPLPEGADAVAMQEDARVSGGAVEFDVPPTSGDYVRRRGEDVPKGTEIDLSGRLMNPPLIGLLASLGKTGLMACRNPRVSVLSTGNELARLGAPLDYGQIYESNHLALDSAIRALLIPCTTGLVPDDPSELRERFAEALDLSDVLITTGGVSVGDHDHVRAALAEAGVREVFWRVAMKPGKPFFFGVKDQKIVFGLPGNPVSAMVAFHVLVRPALLKLKGLRRHEAETTARLGEAIHREDLRYEFVRATLADGSATPVGSQGSHIQAGLAAADALIHVPDGVASIAADERVAVTPLRWGLL